MPIATSGPNLVFRRARPRRSSAPVMPNRAVGPAFAVPPTRAARARRRLRASTWFQHSAADGAGQARSHTRATVVLRPRMRILVASIDRCVSLAACGGPTPRRRARSSTKARIRRRRAAARPSRSPPRRRSCRSTRWRPHGVLDAERRLRRRRPVQRQRDQARRRDQAATTACHRRRRSCRDVGDGIRDLERERQARLEQHRAIDVARRSSSAIGTAGS